MTCAQEHIALAATLLDACPWPPSARPKSCRRGRIGHPSNAPGAGFKYRNRSRHLFQLSTAAVLSKRAGYREMKGTSAPELAGDLQGALPSVVAGQRRNPRCTDVRHALGFEATRKVSRFSAYTISQEMRATPPSAPGTNSRSKQIVAPRWMIRHPGTTDLFAAGYHFAHALAPECCGGSLNHGPKRRASCFTHSMRIAGKFTGLTNVGIDPHNS